MKERHIALVVEDHAETADDLAAILRSIDFDSIVVDNAETARTALQNHSFCLILLDLQIKSEPDSIKGHVEQGKALLRKIRADHGDHNGIRFWLPVIVVSGFAREVDVAVDVMKSGASDIIQKPLESGAVSDKIRRALQESGRQAHEDCHQCPRQRLSLDNGIEVAIPGDRIRRRTRITIAGRAVDLTDASLKVLLQLMVGRINGTVVNKVDLGATADQGFKGISILRTELKPVLDDLQIIKNHYHGDYSLVDDVIIGECAFDKLQGIGNHAISTLAERLGKQPPGAPKKV
jgi:DNA-binding response OmpR family regulator